MTLQSAGRPDDKISDKILERLYRLHPKKIDLSLGRMERILAALDHPERRLPPVIHVAGTNGKGSTTAYLRAMLEAAGLRVHVYTSPHLVKFAERIRLAGQLIHEEHLARVLQECEKANGGAPITYFEITTAAAFKAFSETPADVVVLEVGLGGRLDATNVIDRPLSTVITPVSLDHEQFLGSEVAGIAREKAGIAKPGVPLVIAPQVPEAAAAIAEEAARRGAITLPCGVAWRVQRTGKGFVYEDEGGRLTLPRPNLHGAHQIDNAALALAALRHQDHFTLTHEQICRGLTSAVWPARLQDLSRTALAAPLPKGSELWLDGGHNPAAGDIIAAAFRDRTDLPLYLVCGMMANKDTRGFLKPLAPLVQEVFGLKVEGEDSHSAEDIAAMARDVGLNARAVTGLDQALHQIAARSAPARVLICGSLYLAGQVLARLE